MMVHYTDQKTINHKDIYNLYKKIIFQINAKILHSTTSNWDSNKKC